MSTKRTVLYYLCCFIIGMISGLGCSGLCNLVYKLLDKEGA